MTIATRQKHELSLLPLDLVLNGAKIDQVSEHRLLVCVCVCVCVWSGFGSDFKIIIFFIITVVVSIVTVVLCVAYWHVD